jgi:hypothetical protein
MPNLNDSSPFEAFTGEKIGIYMRQSLTEFPAIAESVKLEFIKSQCIDYMIAQITAWCVGGRIPTNEQSKHVRWPDGAWQMFKEVHMPEWFKDKFPVRWHEEEFKVQTNHYFVCPHLVTDSKEHHIQFMATGSRIAGMIRPDVRY